MHGSHTIIVIAAIAAVLSACSSDEAERAADETQTGAASPMSDAASADLPADLLRAVAAEIPEIKITGAERKERDGRVYYDVEGVKPDGSEIELDLLQENGEFKVVEIQRDIPWTEAPENARAAAAAASKPFEPVRVIESRQTDGSIIYELFADGAPAKPAMEVRVANGQAEVLEEEWPH